MCQKVSILTCGNLDWVEMFCSLKFDLYIDICGSETNSGCC